MSAHADPGLATVEFIYRSMRIDDAWSERKLRGFTWWGHRLAQRVRAEEPRREAGFEVARIHADTLLLTDLLDGPFERQSADRIAEILATLCVFNASTTHSPAVWDERENTVRFHGCAYAHPGNVDWVKRYFMSAVALQAEDANVRLQGLHELVGGKPAWSDHPSSGPRPEPDEMLSIGTAMSAGAGAGASPFGEEDFRSALSAVEQVNGLGFASEDGLQFEAPARGRGRPAVMAMQDGDGGLETALVNCVNDRNPQVGSGCSVKMRLPVHAKDGFTAARLANTLNWAEPKQWSRSHVVGGWCAEDQDVLFTTFLPAASYIPKVLNNVCMSLCLKATWAVAYLEANP